jgi:membrane associated rhomboid family serine protease
MHLNNLATTVLLPAAAAAQVEPFTCYLLAAAQAAVYATATITNNPQAAAAAGDAPDIPQLALALALHPAAAHTDAWQLVTSLLVHSSAPHLVLDLALLLLVAPEVEAVFGHSLLLLLFCLAGVTGSTAAVAAAGGAGADAAAALAGASLGTFGLVGSYLGYCAASPTVASSTHRSNTSSSSSSSDVSSSSSGGSGSKPVMPMTAAVAAGVAGTLCLSVFSQPQLSVSPVGHGAALAAGCLAGYLLGPKFVVIQEVDIPEGSMIVPEDAVETRVVMDQRSGSSRMVAGLVYVAGLAAAISSVVMQ